MNLRGSALSPRVGILLIASLALGACEGRAPTHPRSPPRLLAQNYRMTGFASSIEADSTCISCALDFFVQLSPTPRRSPGVLEYDGVHGGHVIRTVLDSVGNGISLIPDVYGEVVARSLPADQIQILIPIPINLTTESRFYRELASFEGTLGSDGTATGTWKCAPFDISEGYVDTM